MRNFKYPHDIHFHKLLILFLYMNNQGHHYSIKYSVSCFIIYSCTYYLGQQRYFILLTFIYQHIYSRFVYEVVCCLSVGDDGNINVTVFVVLCKCQSKEIQTGTCWIENRRILSSYFELLMIITKLNQSCIIKRSNITSSLL